MGFWIGLIVMGDKIYIATAYLWGRVNDHQYFVAADHDIDKISVLAMNEARFRDFKYGIEVCAYDYPMVAGADREINPGKRALYIKSKKREKKPFVYEKKTFIEIAFSNIYHSVISGNLNDADLLSDIRRIVSDFDSATKKKELQT